MNKGTGAAAGRLLMIDNYDSFTYNLVQYLGELGWQTDVFRNDAIAVEQIGSGDWDGIVISPGPCTPNEAGISMDLIAALAPQLPILGICLGHQSIAQCYGGTIARARRPMHGKLSEVYHDGRGVFAGLPSPLVATRYHSLVVADSKLPDCLEISAWTQHADGSRDEIMGLRHRQYHTEGVQFHPEAIATDHGHDLLSNFLHFMSPSAAVTARPASAG